MATSMRTSTLQTLGLGSVLEIFERGRLPAEAGSLVDEVFGPSNDRGSLVISGANGIVGAGKVMQFASRLQRFGVTIVGLANLPGTVPRTSSQLYANNIVHFLNHLLEDGALKLDLEDEVVHAPLVAHKGEVTNERVREALS